MCTLTYCLNDQGYQLFFNRDEQITRPQAIAPSIDTSLNAAYPIDPTGGGTWIAVHQSGVSLALLNYYQAQIDPSLKHFVSRGVIIPQLLKHADSIHQQLLNMDLSVYQAFQLCVFHSNLSAQTDSSEQAFQYIWDGQQLTFSALSTADSLPITSSGVDYETVSAYRRAQFQLQIDTQKSSENDYFDYHQHQGQSGKCSVKMYREDAKTVSFTQISVNQSLPLGEKVKVEYLDYLNDPSALAKSITL
ncbi:NRDE family protein [uncultured Psychromonas sp.]|uniref:NRDE family protein n=1 Tax=uncultured Psychromonas sp. TaxID=173974 RepID=UPI002606C267|nr:NRDE family protein [uncultured Psychromonas sp.]